MRAVVQRVKEAAVTVDGKEISAIGGGLLVLLGVKEDDTEKEADYICGKIAALRIFEDEQGKMNKSMLETAKAILLVSQFTLCGDCRKGRRPDFSKAARPEKAMALYKYCIESLEKTGVTVKTGRFGAMMDVRLTNDGPVTILLDSERKF
ncbi:MAG: D-aminoacyl-tRNA deacylase [Christensenellales bacterium]